MRASVRAAAAANAHNQIDTDGGTEISSLNFAGRFNSMRA